MRMRWIYLLSAVPILTDLLETGRLPQSPRESITEIALGAVLAGLAWFICRQHDRLAAMAQTDWLTGVFNSRRFHEDLRSEVERARRQQTSLCLAFLDLDGFKSVNDRHGHAEGDALLRRFAVLLGSLVRKHVDRCYRIGGDEFVALIPGSNKAEAATLVDRLRAQAREEPTGLGRYGASVSGSVVELSTTEQADEFLKRADELLYEAKSKGRDRIVT